MNPFGDRDITDDTFVRHVGDDPDAVEPDDVLMPDEDVHDDYIVIFEDGEEPDGWSSAREGMADFLRGVSPEDLEGTGLGDHLRSMRTGPKGRGSR